MASGVVAAKARVEALLNTHSWVSVSKVTSKARESKAQIEEELCFTPIAAGLFQHLWEPGAYITTNIIKWEISKVELDAKDGHPIVELRLLDLQVDTDHENMTQENLDMWSEMTISEALQEFPYGGPFEDVMRKGIAPLQFKIVPSICEDARFPYEVLMPLAKAESWGYLGFNGGSLPHCGAHETESTKFETHLFLQLFNPPKKEAKQI